LVESQKRNIAQLARIGAVVKWRWGLKESLWNNKKKSEDKGKRDEEEGSKDGPRESQEEVEKRTPLLAFC